LFIIQALSLAMEETTMSSIPTHLNPEQFAQHVEPRLSKAKRGFISKIPLYKIFNYILYFLHTGCQWEKLPIDKDPNDPNKREISPDAVAHHFRKWSKDGSLKKVWKESLPAIREQLDLSELNLDGSHTIAKKGGESVAYQGRKKAKTSNVLPITDKNGYILSSTDIIAGNHNDAFNLKPHLQSAFKDIKKMGLDIEGACFNADSAFDTKDARKTCFNHNVIPNIAENKRNRKREKPGPKRLFDQEVYKHRFSSERSFAWVDKFKRLLIRFERKDVYFFGLHCIAFAMINLRHLIS
jgi:transposase